MKEVYRRRGVGRTIGAFALGATAGSILALLFAPAAGEVTRRRIGLKLRALQRESARKFGRARRILARKALDLREAAAQRVQGVVHQMANGHERRATRRRVLRHA